MKNSTDNINNIHEKTLLTNPCLRNLNKIIFCLLQLSASECLQKAP